MLHADIRIDRETDGRTDMTKLIITFLNFANTFKNGLKVLKVVDADLTLIQFIMSVTYSI